MTTFFCSSASDAGAPPASDTFSCSADVSNRLSPRLDVGQTLRECRAEVPKDGTKVPFSDEPEIDSAIARLGPPKVPDRAEWIPHESMESVLRIPLINAPDKFALIDVEDYELIKRYRWRLNSQGYAHCATTTAKRKFKSILMHRLILMAREGMVVDHINHDRLDNRKANIRECKTAENCRNAIISVLNTSGVKGVARVNGVWRACVVCNRIPYYRMFDELEDAKLWIESVRARLHGEFACNGFEVAAGGLDVLGGGVAFFASNDEIKAKRAALEADRLAQEGCDA